MIIDELQKANIEALKAHDASSRAVLSIVLTRYKLLAIEMKASGKQAGDNDVVRIISKVIKELEEEKQGYEATNNSDGISSVIHQMEVISKYLPKMLSEEEIIAEINKLEDKSMPTIMKYFKSNFDGKVDMSLVSKLVRNIK